VTRPAPGRNFAHLNGRIRNAGGTKGDSAAGSREAYGEGYHWIDCNGHASSDAWPFNMHGAPFNPVWIRPGDKLERHKAAWIRKRHPRLRTAETTFRQNERLGLSTEWEVKDLRPVTSDADLELYFARLAEAARLAYGPGWRKRVEVKVLSDLGGGLHYAKRVLRFAHAEGFTTIILPRGKHAKQAISEPYIDFNRGGRVA
jgi:hypothetical protein